MGGSKAQTVGYKYNLGMHMALCHGEADAVTRITVQDRVLWEGEQGHGPLTVNKPNLFGGESREGGIGGTMDVLMGSRDQQPNAYLQSKLGVVPAFRGVVSVVLRNMYIGNNPYLKPWAFRVKRLHRTGNQAQWYEDKLTINEHHMNPAHIIHECLTDRDWGMGYNAQDLDNASFTKAADILYEENFGLSLLWDKSVEIQDFIQTVIQHINAVLYVDRQHGRFVLKLIREPDDYDSLMTIDERYIVSVKDYARPTVAELTNSVTIKYWDMETGNDNTISMQDTALVQQQGAIISTTNHYPGIPDGELASRVAARDLKTVSTPLVGCTLTCDRRVAHLNVGDCFKFSYEDYGVKEIVMRITEMKFGTFNDNKVMITAVQDIFGISHAVFSTAKTEWSESGSEAKIPPHRLIINAPYYELAMRMGDENAANLSAEEGFLIAAASRPSGESVNAVLMAASQGADYKEYGNVDFAPHGEIVASLDYLDETVRLNGSDIDLIKKNTHLQIGDEIVQVVEIVGDLLTIKRGCLDTLPHRHDANAEWWSWDEFGESDREKRLKGESVNVKFLTVTLKNKLALDDAPADVVTITGRHALPYPPANVRFNNSYYPDTLTAPVNISWATRNRLLQTVDLIGFKEGNVSPESGVSYHIKVTVNGSTVIDEDVQATSYNLDDTVLSVGDNVAVELYSVRDGLNSMQTFKHDFVVN